jgi:hypothetical protein
MSAAVITFPQQPFRQGAQISRRFGRPIKSLVSASISPRPRSIGHSMLLAAPAPTAAPSVTSRARNFTSAIGLRCGCERLFACERP